MRYPVNQPFTITQPFGVTDGNAYFGRHSGIDLAGFNQGRPVLAPANATVWWAGWSNTGGNMIILWDGKYYHRLMHNSVMFVSKGNRVLEGQEIAQAGSTGLSTGVHVHWDVATEMLDSLRPSRFDKFVNPITLLNDNKELSMTPEVKAALEDLKAWLVRVDSKVEDVKGHVELLEKAVFDGDAQEALISVNKRIDDVKQTVIDKR